jgi:hypothetical protein
MLKKNEARVMVDAYVLRTKEEKVNKAIAYCDNEISKEIENKADNGHNSVKISVPTNLDREIIINYLTVEGGYSVYELTQTYIQINW